MAAINFPSSPTQGQSHTENGQTWLYDGVKWVSGGTFGQSALTPMYQEGIWTPRLAQNNDLAQIATGYSNQVGRYTRTGNVVTTFCTLNMIDSSGLSSTTQALTVIDFPYKCVNDSAHYGVSGSVHANGWTDGTVVFVNVLMRNNDSRTNPIYYATSSKNGTYGQVNYGHIGTGSLIFVMTYRTDDTTFVPINGATVS